MKRIYSLIVCAVSALSIAQLAKAQTPGTLDAGFGSGGLVTISTNYLIGSGWANDVAIQPDGKIVVAADAANPENSSAGDFYVLRFDPSGSLDPTFGNGGISRFAFSPEADNENPYMLAIQPDGKIVVVGYAPGYLAGVARLNPDGSLDTSFASGGKLIFNFAKGENARATTVKLQSDGKIVIGGDSKDGAKFGFARLNPNGTFDTTFNRTGKLTVSVGSGSGGGLVGLTIQPDGKYIASGSNIGSGRNPRTWTLMRINSSGTLDSGFGSSGLAVTQFSGTWSAARHVAVLPDGKILAGGDWYVSSPLNSSYVVIRYLSNGQIDTSFGSNGKAIFTSPGTGRMEGMAVQADGKIVGSGWHGDPSYDYEVMIMRLNADGTPDLGFGTNGFTFNDFTSNDEAGYSMAVQADGKFVLAGIYSGFNASTTSIGLYRYLP